jgi:hypothetical protein
VAAGSGEFEVEVAPEGVGGSCAPANEMWIAAIAMNNRRGTFMAAPILVTGNALECSAAEAPPSRDR